MGIHSAQPLLFLLLCTVYSVTQQYNVLYTLYYIFVEPEEYNGGRTASDIVAWAEEKAAENVSPPEVKQILTDAEIDEGCGEHPLCVIAFLPHILDFTNV